MRNTSQVPEDGRRKTPRQDTPGAPTPREEDFKRKKEKMAKKRKIERGIPTRIANLGIYHIHFPLTIKIH